MTATKLKTVALFFWTAACFLTASFCIHYAVYREHVGALAIIALILAGAGGFLMGAIATDDK